jgi:signal transduction histidine kinase
MIDQFKIGWNSLRKYSQLSLVGVLVVVFPFLFIFTIQQFIDVNNDNIHTVNKQQASSLQDAIENIIRHGGDIESFVQSLTREQSDLTKFRLIEEIDGKFLTVYDLDTDKVGEIELDASQYRSSLTQSGQSYIYPSIINNERVFQVFRAIESTDDNTKFIFTEHNFSKLDNILDSRVKDAYLILTFIFVFLVSLAYWIARQINYQTLYEKVISDLHERDLFINSLAHELRAPLTAMKGFASLIVESDDTPKTERGYASKIITSTTRLVTLVNDFLQAAKIQAGALSISRKTIDANSLILKVVSQLKSTGDLKSLSIQTTLPEDTCYITNDASRLEQVITNILSNAIKYTQKEGVINVSLVQKSSYYEIIIADNGHGISAEDQKKLFNPFVRVGTAIENTTITGSGLGMWITKQLVEQLGGSITLESIKGVGTHVIIKFKERRRQAN